MDSSQEYNINRLIASNSILCNTIQKLEKRLSEAQDRVEQMSIVIADKDRQLDSLYIRMNEMQNCLQYKDTEIQRLSLKRSSQDVVLPLNEQQMKCLHDISHQSKRASQENNVIPVVKVPANKMTPLIPVPFYACNESVSVCNKAMVPEVEILESDENESEVLDKNKVITLCVTRVNNIMKAVIAQKVYVDTLKKKNEIDLSSIVVEIKCRQATKLWEMTMQLCHKKYKNNVSLLRKSLKFNNTCDAEMFSEEIKNMYLNMETWDVNKIYFLN